MPSRWKQERDRDFYHRQAKETGYRSRASYKLKQLNDRFHFFEDANKILDLGAAPGGWLQVSGESIPDESIIIGVDLKLISPLELENVETVIGDVTKYETLENIRNKFESKIDVVLSDMAPNVSGIWELDHYKQIYLARVALLYADYLLKKDGWLIVKTFQGSEYEKFVKEVKDMFKKVTYVKPKASRKKSAEIYIVAHRLKKNRKLPEEFDDEVPPLK